MIIVNGKILKRILKKILARLSVDLSAHWSPRWLIRTMQRMNNIQLSVDEIISISNVVKKKSPCNFLIFGLGSDSRFWSKINKGETVFVENSIEWFKKITTQNQNLNVHLIDYSTQLIQWRDFLESPELLSMTLPDEINKQKWGVILVDAPEGCGDQTPGRMKSIYAASKLANCSSDIFVHDCDRTVEKTYCDRFLMGKNLQEVVGTLRHYHITNRCA